MEVSGQHQPTAALSSEKESAVLTENEAGWTGVLHVMPIERSDAVQTGFQIHTEHGCLLPRSQSPAATRPHPEP